MSNLPLELLYSYILTLSGLEMEGKMLVCRLVGRFLNGFTVTGGSGMYYSPWMANVAGGIGIAGGAKIVNNRIINNSISSEPECDGAGIFILTGWSTNSENGTVIIANNLVANNSLDGNWYVYGGGLSIYGFGKVVVKVCRSHRRMIPRGAQRSFPFTRGLHPTDLPR